MTAILFGSLLLTALVLVLTLTVMAARSVLAPERPVTVTVNGSRRIATHTGAKLLGALTGDGIMIPSACAGAGTCGLCRVRIAGDGLDTLPTEVARLSKAERRDGVHLACQVVLRSDLAVEVAEDLLGAEAFDCTVGSVRHLTPLIREIVLELPADLRPEVVAGSFLQVSAPPYRLAYADIDVPQEFAEAWAPLRPLVASSDAETTRAYSISNRPEDGAAGRLTLDIRLALPPPSLPGTPPGVVSSWLFQVAPGDRVRASGPFGSFRVRSTEREIVLIGGGVGMAPLRAIVFDQLERLGSDRKISFFYGARSRAELFYLDEFEDLERRHPKFRWTVALSDPQPGDDWDGARGFVHAVAYETYLRDHPAPEACEYYLCGPPLMIRAVYAMLEDVGVERSSIFNDDFGV